jgi:hypothetical protein
MPSNALKIGQLIQLLEGMRGFHGDLDVVFASVNDGALIAVDERNINVEGEALGLKLPEPVLIIGLQRDEAGRVRNMPGERFVAAADASDWTYDRNAAPEGDDLIVWKRRGGQDIGRRIGEKWFVREGATAWPARPVEIIPAGILAWRAP